MFRILVIVYFFVIEIAASAQKPYTKAEYINRFKDVAINEMKRTGIPASITLGQGMLESNNGNSTLAIKANNHFGIKCHKWEGNKFYHNDDAPDECFRKYNSAWESYRDHSNFLTNTKRYGFIFEYQCNDYKNWARGLKKAGYATNPRYATDLIKVIEDNNLNNFDCGSNNEINIEPQNNNSEFTVKSRQTYKRNNVKYIIVKRNEDLLSITKEMDLMRWELRRYNELTDTSQIYEGQILYIQPKRRKAENGTDFHCVKTGETMYTIGQLYAVKTNKLYRKNRMENGSQPVVGQKIWLRKRVPKGENTFCN